MKKLDYRIFIVYLLVLFNLFFTNFVSYNLFGNITNTIINPIIWIIMFIVCIGFSRENKQRVVSRINKQQIIFIIILIYLMFYFIQGLFVGYAKTPYNRSFFGIITNVWSYVFIIVYQEYVRNVLVRNTHGKPVKFLVIILFTFIDINLYSFMQIGNDYTMLFKQVSSVVLPSLAINMLMNYLSESSGYYSCLIFRIPLTLATYLLPILPDLDWYFISIERTLLPFITYICIKNIQEKKVDRTIRRRQTKKKSFFTVLLILVLILFVGFVAGLFKYKPIAIMSNSMYPIISRGDMVVVEKKTAEELKNLKKYDIIEYVLDNIVVVHRIIAVEKHDDGTVLYITKGDNNNTADRKKVSSEQILGVIKLKAPKIGYPSVWLNEYFNKTSVSIETGK